MLHEYVPSEYGIGPRQNDRGYDEQQEAEKCNQLKQLDMKQQKAAMKHLRCGVVAASGLAREQGGQQQGGIAAAAGGGGVGGANISTGAAAAAAEANTAYDAQMKGRRGNGEQTDLQTTQRRQQVSSNKQRVGIGVDPLDPMGYGERNQAVSYDLEHKAAGGNYPAYVDH
jgi:Mrp family chromosome partitioning ATPase